MDRETTRRALLAAALGGGVAAGFLSPASSFLDRFAPLSGSAWTAATANRKSEVSSPYGPAEVRYDEDGVPQVSADDEEALYYAVGYVQGTDRLFQLDLQRRLYSGRLSEIVGDATLESDKFHRKMHFEDAAEATAEHLRTSDHADVVAAAEAYAAGVTAAMEAETLPLEFHLLGYDPEPWSVVDTLLIEKIIGWGLTGGFRTLRKALVRDEFGGDLAQQLYPRRYDIDVPIIRDFHDAGPFGEGVGSGQDGPEQSSPGHPSPEETSAKTNSVDGELVNYLSSFEPKASLGSNSWLVGADLADGSAPILCNDPHLQLQAPPIWYEMHLDGPDHRVRGVTFPGVPFVIIGESDHGTWGFTNANADVIDFYTYDTGEDGRTYQYGDEEREFETETIEIEVAGGPNEEIERKRSVHGPVIEEAEREVGVAWTGHTATETSAGVYDLTHSETMDEAIDAIAKFEVPTQNFIYANRDGETLYQMAGRVPIRRTDGEPVSGDQIFDATEREGEWPGFTPFVRSSFEGFVPFDENPRIRNPSYVGTGNQQIVPDDQLGYYLSDGYTAPYRGERIYALLDDLVESGEPVSRADLEDLGRDTYDGRAAGMVDPLVDAARESDDDDLQDAADTLADWDYQMEPDSRAALIFQVFTDEYRDAIFEKPFEEADLDEEYYPSDGAIERLPPDSGWFGPGGRAPVMRRALRAALDTIDDEGYDVYGDLATTNAIRHPLGLDFLAYPDHPRGGTGYTIWNFSYRGPWGGAWQMHVDLDGEYTGVLAGGNSGRYFSDHYSDQIERWATQDLRTLSREIEGDLVTRFTEDGP